MLLFYVRHGEPIYNPDSLTDFGREQAQSVAKRLAKFGMDKIFASTSNRAMQTAQPLADLLGKSITPLDFCNEKHAGQEFTVQKEDGTRTWAFYQPSVIQLFAERSVALNPKWYNDMRLPPNNFYAGVERVNSETDKWLLSLGYQHDRQKGVYNAVFPNNQRVALFAHQGFGLAFLSSLLDIPYPLFCTHFDIGLSNITVVDFDAQNGVVVPKVLTYSNDGHLYADGLSTEYNYKHIF